MTRIIYDGGVDDVRYRGLLGRRGAWGSAARVYGDGVPREGVSKQDFARRFEQNANFRSGRRAARLGPQARFC